MRRAHNSLLSILLVAFGIFAAVAPWQSRHLWGAPSSGSDFELKDSDLSHPPQIIVYGDTRFTNPTELQATNPKVRRWLVNQIAAEKPDAVLLSGDLPWHGSDPVDYDTFRSETRIWRESLIRIYPALGNHELSGPGPETACIENWWRAFPELRGRRWYSVKLGSSIYVLNLDSNSSLLEGSEQITWIKSQLAVLPATVRYVLFNLHHPPVDDFQVNGDLSHNSRPNEHALADFLVKAPERSRTRFIVTAGHIHNYERFSQDGIIYLVSGGGGAKPRPIVRGPADLYQDAAFPNYNYVKIVQDGENLKGTMVRLADPDAATPSWQEKDHFEISSPGAGEPVVK
jgi:3',5'-cyclic AMP phosphodiesterase CpdA